MSNEIERPSMAPMKDDYDELPTDVCKLPSKGLIYPKDHPLHCKDCVEFKAMGTEQENILATPALLKQGTVLNVLMKSVLIDKSIDTESLLMGDKTALLVSIRISGFGKEYHSSFSCKSCGEEQKYTFDLSKSQIKPLGDDPVAPGENLFEFDLPKSKKKVKFSLLTDGDDTEIAKTQQNRKKAYRNSIIDRTITDRLLLAIKEIGGKTDDAYIAKYVEKAMGAYDSRKLRKHMAEIEPDIILKEEVTCRHCGDTDDRHVTMGYEFFWPNEL